MSRELTQPEHGTRGEKGTKRRWIEEGGLWLALLFAMSPTLRDLLWHWLEHGWARYSLGFLPLILLAIRADSAGWALRGPGLVAIGVALVGQIIVVVASVTFVARPLAALAFAGLLILRGSATPRTAALVAWLVPVPHMVVVMLGGESLVAGQLRVVAGVLSAAGVDAVATDRVLSVGAASLHLGPAWGGCVAAVQWLGLAWYVTTRHAADRLRTAAAMAAALALAGPFQLLVLVLAGFTLSAAGPVAAQLVVDPGSWLVPLLAALHLGRRSAAR